MIYQSANKILVGVAVDNIAMSTGIGASHIKDGALVDQLIIDGLDPFIIGITITLDEFDGRGIIVEVAG